MKKIVDLRGNQIVPSLIFVARWHGIVVCRIEAIPKIAGKALNCMGNSAFFEGFGFRGLQKFTRAVGGMLQTSKPGIRDFVWSPNYIQKADHEFIRWVPLCRCLRRALLAILAVVSLFYQDFCPQTVISNAGLLSQATPTYVSSIPAHILGITTSPGGWACSQRGYYSELRSGGRSG